MFGCVVFGCVAVIDVDRFLVRSSDREAWLWHRSQGVTATMVARAFTLAGFAEVVAQMENPEEVTPNAYMEWGNQREPYIAEVVKERFGVMPNDWVISKGGKLSPDRWMMSTPDGLSLDHKVIGEYKTSGSPLGKTIKAEHVRQMQWQMWVTGAQSCVYAFEERQEGPNGFAPGFDVECRVVERDENLIKELVAVAEKVQQINVYKSWDEREEIENG